MLKKYRNKFLWNSLTEMRPYIPGEDLGGVLVSPEDKPKQGDMIAVNPDNPKDQWLVAEAYFKKHYEPEVDHLHQVYKPGEEPKDMGSDS